MRIRGVATVAGLWLAESLAIWASHPVWLCVAAEDFADRFAPVVGIDGAQVSVACLIAALLMLVTVGPLYLVHIKFPGNALRR
ncbi:NnrS family protein (fragment) [Cupriavidus taiwanensis]|uniref:NnrS family protein n=1 Tax=Cupriavidus taiwanensis TaxID=164546 RepID=A0A7Z7JHW7_9BURK